MALEEELDEFEVLWSEPDTSHTPGPPPPPPPRSPSPVQVQAPDAHVARSRPVDVPGRPKAARSRRWNGHGPRDDSSDHDNDGGGGGGGNGSKIVPPHLLLSAGWRRSPSSSEEEAEPAAWTVRAYYVGPPCKRARDLRRLRDSVLRMTGFIEG